MTGTGGAPMLLAEYITAITVLLQGMLLVTPRSRAMQRCAELLPILGLGGSAAALLAGIGGLPVAISFGMLEDQPLFRLPRAALLLSGLLLTRIIASTRELPEARKPEVLFLFTILALLCDLLILSRHMALSVILLVLGSWVGLFLGGLAYRGRREGEAVLKFWIQASLSLTAGFGAIVVLSLVAGGADFARIGEYMQAQAAYSPSSLLVVTSVFLPFFLAGGFFPFHFITVDRDHGLPWSVQTALSVTFQGAVAVAAWKMGVVVFGHVSRDGVSEGLRVLQLCGLTGGFWLAIFALSQGNSKRLYSALVGAQWGAVLAAGVLPSSLGASAIAYALSSTFLWTAALGFVWARFQEWAGDESISAVYGAAKSFRVSGLMLLLALGSPLLVPGLPGLPTALHLLAAMIEQKSLIFLSAEVALLSLLCLSCIRIGTDLLFRERPSFVAGKEPGSFLHYGVLDWGVMGAVLIALVAGGFLWQPVLGELGKAAGIFLS